MIDISRLTEEELDVLEINIRCQREKLKRKDNVKKLKLKGYKVTFYVRFDPERHKYCDVLFYGGALDTGHFADYLCDKIVGGLMLDFDFGPYGGVSYPHVEVATQQEIEDEFW